MATPGLPPPTILESDPQDILLDSDGDIVLDDQGLHWASGVAGVVQGARIRMLMFAGEWFLNLDVGLDYYGDILFENYDETRARAGFTAAILDTPGILAVTSLTFSLNPQSRVLAVTWSASTQFGDTSPDTLNLSGPTTVQSAES